MPFPLWSPEYLHWQFFADDSTGRQFCVTAYDGSKIVGCLLAKPCCFQIHSRQVSGTIGSWLSIHPDYRWHGVWLKLLTEQRRRHLKYDKDFMLGYVYTGSTKSLGAKFWNQLPGFNLVPLTKLNLWIRPLDHKAVAKWAIIPRDRRLANLSGIFQSSNYQQRHDSTIRFFETKDLEACVTLINSPLDHVDIGLHWNGPEESTKPSSSSMSTSPKSLRRMR